MGGIITNAHGLPKMKIFISYRRFDSIAYAGRIHDRLVATYGEKNVFKDVDDIPIGQDFRTILTREVSKCDVLLVLIGRTWLDARDANGNRRLDDVDDFVRTEIRAGLRRANCLVIPMLLSGAQMPQSNQLPDDLRELAYKNAVSVRDDPDFHRDMVRLIDALDRYESTVPIPPPPPVSRFTIAAAGLLILLVLVAGGITLRTIFQEPTSTPIVSAIPSPTATVPTLTSTPSPTATIPTLTSTPSPTATVPTLTSTPSLTPIPPTSVPTATDTPEPPTAMPTAESFDAALVRAERGVTTNTEWIPYIQDFNGINMVLVPRGCFTIGANPQESDEQNGNRRCFPPFFFDQTEVTQEQFRRFSGRAATNPSFSGDDMPVENITWFEARDFCRLYRGASLPTEAEWEYVARGPDELNYPWGDEWIPINTVWNRTVFRTTANVGSIPDGASWVGALDMSGNVWEWVNSLYMDYPYDLAHENTLIDVTSGRVLRGGSWYDYDSDILRSGRRSTATPNHTSNLYGFRCVRSIIR
jgi:formylglycine-generating enzyme required for sulfatase activity